MAGATIPVKARPQSRASVAAGTSGAPVLHSYPLHVRDASLVTAFGLVMRSLPYATMRFTVQLALTIGGTLWLVASIDGAAWLATHVAHAFGSAWMLLWIIGIGWFWWMALRYALYLIDCGHVAVLTELITRGQIGDGSEAIFAYGRRIVTQRFGQVNVLFGLNSLVRGVLQAFHRTLDWIGDILPIPGVDAVAGIVNLVLQAATRYLDKVIFSYNLARDDDDPWRGACEGVIYYCQNAKPILKTSVLVVVQECVLTFLLWIVLLSPAAGITMLLPQRVSAAGGLVSVVIAILLTSAVRSAFLKPIFLAKMMIRFHALVENQPINESWDAHLSELSDKFRDLGRKSFAATAALA
jgi:hypothetical protein